MQQLQDYSRGFSFNSKEKIDMQMGLSFLSAEEVVNTFDEKTLKLIIKFLEMKKKHLKLQGILLYQEEKKNFKYK